LGLVRVLRTKNTLTPVAKKFYVFERVVEEFSRPVQAEAILPVHVSGCSSISEASLIIRSMYVD
jgi:hypothetical protein